MWVLGRYRVEKQLKSYLNRQSQYGVREKSYTKVIPKNPQE